MIVDMLAYIDENGLAVDDKNPEIRREREKLKIMLEKNQRLGLPVNSHEILEQNNIVNELIFDFDDKIQTKY